MIRTDIRRSWIIWRKETADLMDYRILGKKNLTPVALKTMTEEERVQLCSELRDKILNTVASNGGHLASNLGIVELTIALHRVFSSPDDAIIFDVSREELWRRLELRGRADDTREPIERRWRIIEQNISGG